ncbi:MAG: hypothetical protein GDA44_05605 [Prochloron sp. SP5CPC1]|nr:hypothetical protein [Candidatus Paraprochloron terpiosi SP5CPC1]
MPSLDHLKPVGQEEIIVYIPYCSKEQRNLLPLVISLYKEGALEGERGIEGCEGVPYLATWDVSKLPLESTRFQLIFNQNADLSYEITMSNAELIKYLIALMDNYLKSEGHSTDFSDGFYRKLLVE